MTRSCPSVSLSAAAQDDCLQERRVGMPVPPLAVLPSGSVPGRGLASETDTTGCA